MQKFDRENIHFYSEVPHFINRVRLIGFLFLFGWPISEYLFTEVFNFYESNWWVVIPGSTAIALSLLLIRFRALNKFQIAYWVSLSSALVCSFLIYRLVTSDFKTMILLEAGVVIVFLTTLFDRKRFVLAFILPVIASFIVSLFFLDWTAHNDWVYFVEMILVLSFFLLSYYFKLFRLRLLRFSERVIGGFDQYLMVSDESGNLVFLNDYAAEKFGFDLEKRSLKEWWEFRKYSKKEIEEVKKEIKDAIKSNVKIPSYEQDLVLPNGQEVTIEWNDQIVSGKFYFGIGTDISKRKAARLEAEKFSKVSYALNAGIILSNDKGEITWCNSHVEEIFGYKEEEILGKRPSLVFKVPLFFKEKYNEILSKGLKDGESVEIAHYHKSGRIIWILLNFSSFLEDNGENVEVITDITEQKNKELEYQQISLIATRTQTPVLICDREYVVNWMNDALTNEFNTDFSEVIGNNFFNRYINEKIDITEIEELKTSLDNQKSTQVEIRLINKGKLVWYKLSVDPIIDEVGKVTQFMIIMQNIQHFKDAQLVIEQKNKDMVDSISYAQRIQSAILPDHAVIESFLPKHFFFYRPKDIVSGDFYYVKKHNGLMFIAVADCTGHGVPGAMISSIGSAALHNAIFDHSLVKPNEILEHADEYLKEALSARNNEMTDGMDLGLLVLDEKENKLLFSGAKRPLILVNRNTKNMEVIKGSRRSIGEFYGESPEPFQVHEFELFEDKSVYLFSDGIPDQFGGEKHKKIGMKRTMKFIEEIGHLHIEERLQGIEDRISEWMVASFADQTDDMLFFGMDLKSKNHNQDIK